MICPNCGLENGNRSVCKKCGTFLNNKQTQRVTDPQEIKKMKRSKRIMIAKSCVSSFFLMAAAFIVISVILMGIIYLLTRNMKWPTEEELAAEASIMESMRQAEENGGEDAGNGEGGPSVSISEEP